MSKSISNGLTYGSAATFNYKKLDIAKNFAIRTDEPNECVVVNINTPAGQSNTLRYAIEPVRDVIKGTDVYYPPVNTTGSRLLIQSTQVNRVIDDVDATYCVDLPIQVSLTVKYPNSELITDAQLVSAISDILGAVVQDAADPNAVLKKLMRGAMRPTSL